MKKQTVTQSGNQKSPDARPAPGERTEKDADDLVHSQAQEEPLAIGEDDPDDKVHRPYTRRPGDRKEDSLEDPDDLVHEQPANGDQDL